MSDKIRYFHKQSSKFVMKFRYIWYEFLYCTKFHWSYFLSSDEIIEYRKRCEIKNPQKRELNTSQSLFNDVPVSVVKVTYVNLKILIRYIGESLYMIRYNAW